MLFLKHFTSSFYAAAFHKTLCITSPDFLIKMLDLSNFLVILTSGVVLECHLYWHCSWGLFRPLGITHFRGLREVKSQWLNTQGTWNIFPFEFAQRGVAAPGQTRDCHRPASAQASLSYTYWTVFIYTQRVGNQDHETVSVMEWWCSIFTLNFASRMK